MSTTNARLELLPPGYCSVLCCSAPTDYLAQHDQFWGTGRVHYVARLCHTHACEFAKYHGINLPQEHLLQKS